MQDKHHRLHNRAFIAVLVLTAVYYLFLLSNGDFQPVAPELLDRVYGWMALNLLHGDFTVPRQVIQFESFTRNGRVLTYFGDFPAALRLLAWPFHRLTAGGLARLSCWIAMVLFVGLQLRMLLVVHESLRPEDRSRPLLAMLAAATVLSGPQLYLLGSAWIYHESVFWSAAQAACFSLVVLQAALAGRTLRGGELALLAALAGVALNTRPSVGAGLVLSFGLVLAWTAWETGLLRPRILGPAAILVVLGLAAAWVNYGRWGNPLTFADFRDYDFAHRQPARLAMILTYHELNLGRIPVALLYYATGLPYVFKNTAPFAEYLRTHFDGLEAPPLSGLLANPLTIVLAALGAWRLFWRPELPRSGIALLRLTLIGYAAIAVMVLMAMYLTLRYRMDFAPLTTLLALLGYRALSIRLPALRPAQQQGLRAAVLVCCLGGIAVSHYTLVIHKVWSGGVPMDVRRTLLPLAPFARAALP